MTLRVYPVFKSHSPNNEFYACITGRVRVCFNDISLRNLRNILNQYQIRFVMRAD